MSEQFSLSWLRLYLARIVRIIFAGILAYLFVSLFYSGKTLLVKDTQSIIITPISITTTEPKQPAHAVPEKAKPDKSTSENRGEQIITTERKGTATQQVWIYGLQLVAWVGMLGLLLGAIVILIRDE